TAADATLTAQRTPTASALSFPGLKAEACRAPGQCNFAHRMELRCPPHSAAGKAPTALRVQVRGIALLRRLGAYAQQGGQCNALATGRGFGASRIRRPEKRRPPYGYRFAASRCCVGSALMPSRVVNATHWPPDAASVHPALSGREDADRPTGRGSRHRGRRVGWALMA